MCLNVMENLMLQQMQQMAANIANTLPQTENSGKNQSFQDMMVQAGKETSSPEAPKDTESPEQPDKPAEGEVQEKPAGQQPEKDAAKAQELCGDPNAMQYVMDLFRPHIVEVAQTEAVAEAPAEIAAVPEAVVAEMPVEQTAQIPVEETVEAAAPVESVPETVQQAEAMPVERPEEAVAVQETVREDQDPQEVRPEVQSQEAAPEKTAEIETVEIKEAPKTTGEKPEEDAAGTQDGTAPLSQQPLFHEAEAAPVKVAENYKTVDTQAPDLEEKLADTIRQAAADGAQRLELRLNPANLGQVTIELTRDAGGVLQVALHVVSGKAESLLSQHLDGLHAALQSYGQGQEVRLEVQRNQEAPQQQNQHQANPDGHQQNQQHQRQQERRQEETAGDFLQKLRLGLFEPESL